MKTVKGVVGLSSGDLVNWLITEQEETISLPEALYRPIGFLGCGLPDCRKNLFRFPLIGGVPGGDLSILADNYGRQGVVQDFALSGRYA